MDNYNLIRIILYVEQNKIQNNVMLIFYLFFFITVSPLRNKVSKHDINVHKNVHIL